jgi:hypothetical protein
LQRTRGCLTKEAASLFIFVIMMKYCLLIVLIFIFSCKQDTEKIIPGKWDVTGLNYPQMDKMMEKMNKGATNTIFSNFVSNDFYHFYGDNTFTALTLGSVFTYGKWKWDHDKKAIILQSQEKPEVTTWSVIKTGSSRLVMQDNTSIVKVQLTLKKDHSFDKHEKDDYTSLYNNKWRIKPDSSESYEEIVKRVRSAVHFCVLFLSEPNATAEAVPLPLVFTLHGMRIAEESEIENKWKQIFFNDNDALQAYHIFKNALPSEPVTKDNSSNPKLADLLKRTELNIR